MSRMFGVTDWIVQQGADVFSQCPFSGYGHMGYYGYGGHFMGFLIIILLIAVIYLVMRAERLKKAGSSAETPLDVLKHRYAKGEISKEQFETMKQDLKT